MTLTVRPLPCNYCVSALCLHGTKFTHLHAYVKAKGGYFEHNLLSKVPINSDQHAYVEFICI